jgi:hypothetical protein
VYTVKVYGGMEVEFPSFLQLSIDSQAGHFGEEITLALSENPTKIPHVSTR